ncbi:hypothetical protein [Chryseobacterium sp. Leaf394]|uniref:hypothetical protein n=1 Tax=Chryseobacterium sp. Leaf394 TaxID=1736361 RepID=UPI0006FE23AE|nr:hypothetical protein [Chryseobacterium sp. Leaf394]KQS90240.1 hypothetical protein ASG21_14905 [Chryseobacterium sp. Leaf394]
MNSLKNTGILVLMLISTLVFSQEKKKFASLQNVLAQIIPNDKYDFWVLVYNEYGKNKEVKISGSKKDYLPQFSGFDLTPSEDTFFYIVNSKGGKISYITDLKDLKPFIGKIDNAEEAALSAVLEGYIIDDEFVDLAANYHQDAKNYYLDLGKVTSQECPYQKKHFTLTVSKTSGMIEKAEENGSYIELYNKKCKNNPRLLKIEKKPEPKDDPKKQPAKRR